MASPAFLAASLCMVSIAVASTLDAVAMTPGGVLQRQTDGVDGTYKSFLDVHDKDYKHGSEEYATRKALFEKRLAAVDAHNAKPLRLWKAGLSKFSDHTEEERKAVRGYKRSAPREEGASLFQRGEIHELQTDLPDEKSWTSLSVANNIKDQGSCGSCWAISTTSVLEAHYEIYSKANGGADRTFSPQEVLECTPNPDECGGQGGCKGATVELGMKYILANGLATEENVPYLAEDGTCKAKATPGAKNENTVLQSQGGAAFGLMGYRTLKSNDDGELVAAIANYGPVAVSASAGGWFEYSSGIFDSCDDKENQVVDHAIVAYGYGKGEAPGGGQVKYWHIRNSWGSSWGESGFIRILRQENAQDHCATDASPLEGVDCKYPLATQKTSATVCGMCGILYDSVVPYFKGSKGHSLAQLGSNSSAGAAHPLLMRAEAKPH